MISTNIGRIYSRSQRTVEELSKENARLANAIANWKNKINYQKKWDIAKKYTNEYEFIFSFNNEGVADITPISRSFFKIIEILIDHRIMDRLKESLHVAALCEGPGGFIQGIEFVCESNRRPIEHVYAITLRSNDKRIPDWKIKETPKIHLLEGVDQTGNLYSVDNIEHFLARCEEKRCNLITADGGFDFSSDFNSQENDFLHLLLCEIYTAVRAQQHGGCFIVKMFDLFRSETIQLIAMLCDCYHEVYIHKPRTSRPANSERYIVCLNFLGVDSEKLRVLREMVTKKTTLYDKLISKERYENTMNHVVDANKTYVQTQITYIEKTLKMIQDHAIFDKKKYESHCLKWCKLYQVPVKDRD